MNGDEVSMYTASALSLELYDDWRDITPTKSDVAGLGSRDEPIDLDLDPSPQDVVKLEELWKEQCPELVVDVDPTADHQQLMPFVAPPAWAARAAAATTTTTTASPPAPPPPLPPAPKPQPDAFERYLKLKMKKLDRKRRLAEEEAQRWARERRDVIESIDSIAEPGEEGAQLSVELAAWDTRVKQMEAAVLAAKAGRKATRLKMELREYRRKKKGLGDGNQAVVAWNGGQAPGRVVVEVAVD